MDPMLVVLSIRAIARLGQAGSAAMTQYATDRPTLLPNVLTLSFPDENFVRTHFATHAELITGELREHWAVFDSPHPTPLSKDVMCAAYMQFKAKEQEKYGPAASEATAQWLVTQWGRSGPVGPLGSMLLTITDVALEFVAHDPSMFGIGGKAEPLIKAMARNMTELIPDDTNALGPKNTLAQRLAAAFLRAGLQAIAEHPNVVLEEGHLQTLIKSTLPKIVDAIPSDLSGMRRRDIIEALMGPVAQAAVATLADNPQAFFGRRFSDDNALGALTRSFLLKVSERGLDDSFTREGAVDLWRAALKLASQRPELFLGNPDEDAEKFVSAVFKDLTANLEMFEDAFGAQTVRRLTVVALGSISTNAGLLIDPGKPWEGVAGDALQVILGAIKEAIGTSAKGSAKLLTSEDMLTALVRVVLQRAAQTPGMILKSDNEELKSIVAAVAGSMAKDDHLLLSKDDWLAIATTAAEEAASNPARLFGFLAGTKRTDIAVPLIEGLLRVAASQWRQLGRAGGSVLFGATLRDAIAVALRAASGNAKAALTNAGAVERLAQRLSEVVAGNPGKYGSKEWLRLYRVFIGATIEQGDLGALDDKKIEEALTGGLA
jgi:hypothetical protein